MIYSTGKNICHGGKEQLKKYARLVKRKGYPVRMLKIKTITMSAVYTLRRKVEHWKIVQKLQGSYKPEIFHGIGFIREGIHYTPPVFQRLHIGSNTRKNCQARRIM